MNKKRDLLLEADPSTETELHEVSRDRGALGVYLCQMRHDLLTAEEERGLGARLGAGDTGARDKLVRCNLRLVVSVARKFARGRTPLGDIIQCGNEGLLKAVDRWNPGLGFRFSTYAVWWIRAAIFELVYQESLVHVPPEVQEDARKVMREEKRLLESGKRANDELIAAGLGIPVERVRSVRKAIWTVIPLDSASGEDGDRSLHEILVDAATEHRAFDAVEHRQLVARLLERLRTDVRTKKKRPEVLIEVVMRTYGLGDFPQQSVKEVATAMGMSVPKVRERLAMAMRCLKAHAWNVSNPQW